MASRRWLLLAVSLGSLVLLSYGAVLLAYSVPVDDGMASANTVDNRGPRSGTRAVVAPLADPADVPTFVQGAEGEFSRMGALLIVADPGSTFPASARGVGLVRALVFVDLLANQTYARANVTLSGVPTHNGTMENVTLDVPSLAGGREGFLVKGDAEDEIRFVPVSHVLGRVRHFESTSALVLILASGSFGFLAPLVAIVLTHRGGARGARVVMQQAAGGACPECRRPAPVDADFCMKCGAWLPRKSS